MIHKNLSITLSDIGLKFELSAIEDIRVKNKFLRQLIKNVIRNKQKQIIFKSIYHHTKIPDDNTRLAITNCTDICQNRTNNFPIHNK